MMSYLFVLLGHLKQNRLDTVDAVIFTLSFLTFLFM